MLRSSIKCGFDVNVMVDAPAMISSFMTSVLKFGCVLRIMLLFLTAGSLYSRCMLYDSLFHNKILHYWLKQSWKLKISTALSSSFLRSIICCVRVEAWCMSFLSTIVHVGPIILYSKLFTWRALSWMSHAKSSPLLVYPSHLIMCLANGRFSASGSYLMSA